MKLTEQEVEKLRAAKSRDEWNAVLAKIKAVRAGDLPTDWYVRVVKSGFASEVAAKF